LVFVILTNGFSYSIAGNNVRGLKYDKVFDGPPYSARDSNAEDLYAHRLAAGEGATKIGSFEILASGPNEASKIASEEAAKLGADYYWIDPESGYQHTKKRYVRDDVSSTKIGNQNITTERYHYDDKAVKGIYVYSCFIYRKAPTKEEAGALRSFGLFSCLNRCTSDSLTADRVSSALELTYQLRKVNNVFQGYEIKFFFECLSQKPKPHRKYPHFIGHPMYFERGFQRDMEKVNLLLDRGLVNRKDYYKALQMVRATHYDEDKDFIKPTKPSGKLSRNQRKYYDYSSHHVKILKLHFEFLKQVETALVGYKLPEPTNNIDSIQVKIPTQGQTASELFKKASALWKGGQLTDPDKAIAYLSKVIRLDSQYGKAYHYRGLAWYGKGNYDRSCHDYQKACKLGFCTGLIGARKEGYCK